MVRRTSNMFVTGPNVVKTVTHEDVSMEELGGADTHAATSGVAHRAFDSEPECLNAIRELFRYIPSNNLSDPPRGNGKDARDRRAKQLLDVVPDNPNNRAVAAILLRDGGVVAYPTDTLYGLGAVVF
jgi:propionyl-CoA carboxylase beta chain